MSILIHMSEAKGSSNKCILFRNTKAITGRKAHRGRKAHENIRRRKAHRGCKYQNKFGAEGSPMKLLKKYVVDIYICMYSHAFYLLASAYTVVKRRWVKPDLCKREAILFFSVSCRCVSLRRAACPEASFLPRLRLRSLSLFASPGPLAIPVIVNASINRLRSSSLFSGR